MFPIESNILFADRYRLIKRIGRGGFAEVWLAADTLTDLQVAIKIYDGMDEDGLKIFVGEINRVYHLNHTNLLKPQHVAAWNNMPYLVMTYCSAGSCEKKIGQIKEQDVWKILHDVASGLAYLHSYNIIHQDIKPANILQDDMGNYVIIDFGISTLARDTLVKSTLRGYTNAGTLAYMAPERFSKDPTPIFASDIWSLGAMLFELLEGKTPFPANVGGGMQQAGAEVPDITANISNELKRVISKTLSINTWDRPTASTLVEWAKNPSAIEKPSRPTQRKITKPAEQPQQPNPPKSKRWIWITSLCIVFIYFLPTIVDMIRLDSRDVYAYVIDFDGSRGDVFKNEVFYVELFQGYNCKNNFYRIDGAERVRHNSPEDSYERGYLSLNETQFVVIKSYHTSINGINIKISTQRYEVKKRSASAVDLGLSVKWADCNLGATRSKNYGSYFAWGEINPKINYILSHSYYSHYKWDTYKLCNGSPSSLRKYSTNNKYGIVDNKINLEAIDDAATKLWGGNWRIPTKEEFQELIDKCEWKKKEIYGNRGYEIISKINGNRIFLPAAGCRIEDNLEGEELYGYYWSSTLDESDPRLAYMLNFGVEKGRSYKNHKSLRYIGRCVRPVCP
jgi:serine/threonine protein kinase